MFIELKIYYIVYYYYEGLMFIVLVYRGLVVNR